MPASEVLITRPLADSEATAARLRARGFIPVLAPLLQVTPRHPPLPPQFDAVLLTSGNALAGLSAAACTGRLVLAVGDATADRARAAGFHHVESAGGDATDLVQLAAHRCPPGARLLLAVGRGQSKPLAATLRAAGFRVRRRVVYAATPVNRFPATAEQALRRGQLHAALFLSAETARTFARLAPISLHPALASVDALVIGRPAADALALLPWRQVRVSLAPTLDQVLALL